MARITKQAQLDALRVENAQLRAAWAAEIELRNAWEQDAKRARRALVQRSHAAQTTVVAQSGAIGSLARAYCEANGVRSCTREQALSMAG